MEPHDLDFAKAATANTGTVPLACDRTLARELLPALCEQVPCVSIAEIMAITRVVGMICPGLHSLFAGLDLAAGESHGGLALTFRVVRANQPVSLIDLGVRGPTLAGKVRAFVRPKPQAQLDMSAVSKRVSAQEFAGQRALVIGGSRGLGEVTAKCIAAGGGRVALTYYRGADDASRVVDEIAAGGGSAFAISFDCLAPPADLAARLRPLGAPTHLNYFATPFISVDKNRGFSAERYREYARYYVEGFAETVQTIRAIGGHDLIVLYPSTVFLDERPVGAAEYCAAKAAGEEICRHLEKVLPRTRIVHPRLPRMRTDQTASILNGAAQDPLDVILETLRALS